MPINEFYTWFNSDSPNFFNQYGDIRNFYDVEADIFYIEDIQIAYEQFKSGENPNTLYYCWGQRE